MRKVLAMRKLTALAIIAALPFVGVLEGCAANRCGQCGQCGAGTTVYDDGLSPSGMPAQQPSSGPVRRMLEGSMSR